ncbi:sulfatase [bacterium]|nr:sulfatase [bacterium]
MGRLLRGLFAGLFAGALGGALVGIGESALVTFTSAASDEYWLVLFGVVAYGAIGAGCGAAAALAWQLVRRGAATDVALARVGAFAGMLPLAFAVAQYQINQRVFDEGLSFASSTGAMAYGAILVVAVLVSLVAVLFAGAATRAAGVLGPALAVGVLALVGWGIGAATDHSGMAEIARHASGAAAGKPNVILVVVDTLRSDASRTAAEQPGGFATIHRDGVAFERAYAQASWTRPSIATLLTSEYPSVHRTEHKMDILPNDATTLAEVLKGQGYWTAAFTTNINVAPIFNFQQGFDEFHYLEPSFYFGASDSATKLAVYKGLRAAREKMSNKIWVENFYQDAHVVDQHVEAWLGSKPPEPFFLFVHYMDPHDPYFEIPYDGRGIARVSTPNPPAGERDELHDLYMESVRYHDHYLGELLERLKAQGLYDRSVVAVTADHGEEFHEHGGWWHGTTLYEEALHVPLIIKRPNEPEPGHVRTDLARLLDVAPTLVAAAGAPAPANYQGIDLFTGTVTEPLLAEEDLEGNKLTSLRSGDWKLITANPGNPRGLAPHELYDLASDPREKTNVAGDQSGKVADMLAQLDQMKARIVRGRTAASGTARTHAADPGA